MNNSIWPYILFFLLAIRLLVGCDSIHGSKNRVNYQSIQRGLERVFDDSVSFYFQIQRYDSVGNASGFIINQEPNKHIIDTIKFVTSFYKGGEAKCITVFHIDSKMGTETCFSKTALLVSQGQIIDSLKHGKWVYYDAKGKIQETVWYVHGEIFGGKELFNPSGEMEKYCLTTPSSDCLFFVGFDQATKKYFTVGTPLLFVRGKNRERNKEGDQDDKVDFVLITARCSAMDCHISLLEKQYYNHLSFITFGEIGHTGRYILSLPSEEPLNGPLPVILETHYKFSDSVSTDTVNLSLLGI